MRPYSSLLLGISATVALAACDSSSGGGAVVPPSTVDYGGFLGAVNCATLDPLVPTFDGTGLTFSAEPALPAGLDLNAFTGVITGTPAAPEGTTFHTITASNAQGSASAGLTVGLTDPAAPSGLAYPEQQLSATIGAPLGSLVPTLAAGGATSYAYSISPALPAGLALDPATGTLSGTPAVGLPPSPFVVRAGDCVGNETSSLLWLEVAGGALPASSSPNLALVANADGTVSIAKVDPASGRLVALGYGPAGGSLADVVVSPDQSTVFTLLSGQNAIQGFALENSGAGLVPLPAGPSALPGAGSVGDLLVSPDGDHVYASDPAGSRLYGFAVGSFGALEALPGSPFAIGSGFQNPTALRFSGDGELIYTLNAATSTVSALRLGADGAVVGQAAQPTGAGPADLAALRLVNGRELLYVANATDATISVFQADPVAPALTLVQTRAVPSGSFPEKLQAVRVAGQPFVYALKTATQLLSPLAVQPSTGLLDPIQAGIGAPGVSDFGFSAGGRFGFLLSAANNQLTPIAVAPGGALSAVAADGAPVDGLLQRGGPLALEIVGSPTPLTVRSSKVFVANAEAGTVGAFDVVGGGNLLQGAGEIAVGGRPTDTAVRPQGQRLYVVDNDGAASDDLLDYYLNGALPTVGNSTEIGAPLFAGVGDARRLTVDPSGRFLLAVRGGAPGQVFSFRLDDLGALGQGVVDDAGNDPEALEVDPSGRFVYVANRFGNNVSQHRIDAQTGALSLVSAASVGAQPLDLALSPSGARLYTLEAGNGGSIGAYLVNPNSGVLNLLGTSPDVSGAARALAVDANGRYLVVADGDELRVFRISTGEPGVLPGVPTLLDTVALPGTPSDVAFDLQGQRVFVTLAGAGEVKTFGFSAGVLTLLDTDAAGAGAAGIGLLRSID